jgi:orotate phosphoribosyltransferase
MSVEMPERPTAAIFLFDDEQVLGFCGPFEVFFVGNGKVVTSRGVAAGIDMSLHFVGRLVGEHLAEATERTHGVRMETTDRSLTKKLNELVQARRGHFLLESGHHGELWLDLELLCLHPKRIEPLAVELARRLVHYRLDAVCGPLVEGAFVAMMVAKELDVDFFYTEPIKQSEGHELYATAYRLPAGLRKRIEGKRVAIVNDVINAGSAVRGTYVDLESCHARPVAIASLLTLGETPKALADAWKIDLITIGRQPNAIWAPDACPLCADQTPLENV